MIVRGQRLPCEPVVDRDKYAGAVSHGVTSASARRILGVKEVVKVKRWLVGVVVARKAKRIRDHAAVGTARQVVVVATGRDRTAGSEVFLPVVPSVALGPELVGGVNPGGGVATTGPELFEAEVHASVGGATDGRPCVIWRSNLIVGAVTSPQSRGVPEVDVER